MDDLIKAIQKGEIEKVRELIRKDPGSVQLHG
jgi:hypothetical protein